MINLTSIQAIQKFIGANNVAVLEFGAPWCQPCKNMEPTLSQLQERYLVEVGKVDIDQLPEARERYFVSSLPTLVLFIGGQPKDSLTGLRMLNTIVSTFNLERRN